MKEIIRESPAFCFCRISKHLKQFEFFRINDLPERAERIK